MAFHQRGNFSFWNSRHSSIWRIVFTSSSLRIYYSDWYSHWDLVGRPSIPTSHLLGCLSCLIEQWHIFYWAVLLGFGLAYTSISQLFSTPPFPPPLPPPFPPRHLRRSLVSPPWPCLSSSTCSVVRVSWIHNGSGALGWGFWRTGRRCPPPRCSSSLGPTEYRQSIPLVSLREAVQHPPTW